MNDFAEEATYRFSGEIELDGQPNISLTTMLAPSEHARSRADAAGRMVGRQIQSSVRERGKDPETEERQCTIDLLPERRIASIENAWIANNEVRSRNGGSSEGLPAALSRRAH